MKIKSWKKDYSVAMKYDFTTFHDCVIFGVQRIIKLVFQS